MMVSRTLQKAAMLLTASVVSLGVYQSPAADKEATLRLTVDTGLSDIGSDPGIKPPSEFLPDADKPAGIASALDRFGIPRGGPGKDAGVEPEAGEEEP